MVARLRGLKTKKIVYWCLSFKVIPFVLAGPCIEIGRLMHRSSQKDDGL